MKREKSCGAVVIDNGKVLIVKQISGFYGFPKGHVEPNESEETTAIREVKEETNIDITVDSRYRYATSYIVHDTILKEVVFFLGRVISNEYRPEEREISEVLWLPYEDVLNKLTYDDSKKLLQDLLECLENKNGDVDGGSL